MPITIAFDVDGTLIHPISEKPRKDIVEMLKILNNYATIIVWSGGGREYAEMIGRRLNLPENIVYASKTSAKDLQVDIAFDDMSAILADKMIYV
jgi:phosphoserine phosphatase